MAQISSFIPLIDEDTSEDPSSVPQVVPATNNNSTREISGLDTGDGLVLGCIKDAPNDSPTDGSDVGPTRQRNSTGTNVRLVPKRARTNVKPATQLREASDEVYKMTARKRGYCVIINNLDFDGRLKYRHGSKEEGEMLERLFQQLGFEVVQIYDAKRDQMIDTFEEYSKIGDQWMCDAFIGIVLTHGDVDNLVHGSDGMVVEVAQLIDFFNNRRCPALIHKPKMFFIQACRGRNDDHGVALEYVSDAAGTGDLAANVKKAVLPTWGDTMVCYSTVDGFTSNRNETYGSWFGDALNSALTDFSCDMELHQLLIKVNNELMCKEGSNNLKQSLEVVYRGWAKNLYFNPGLAEA